VDLALVKQVDRVDRHRHVSGVLAASKIELLVRANAKAIGNIGPALERILGPVAIGAADVHLPQLSQDGKHGINSARIDIVGINQQGDVLGVNFGHVALLGVNDTPGQAIIRSGGTCHRPR